MRWSVRVRSLLVAAALAVGAGACFDGRLTWENMALSSNRIKILTGLTAPITMNADQFLPNITAELQTFGGEKIADGAGTVSLGLFIDSACTQSPDPARGTYVLATSTFVAGSAFFDMTLVGSPGHVGTYYFRLYMNDGAHSDCSPSVQVSPGAAHHAIVGVPGSPPTLTVGAVAQSVGLQIVDAYGNPTSTGTACSLSVSITRSPSGGTPSVGTPSPAADAATGAATTTITPGTKAGALAVNVAPGTCTLAGPAAASPVMVQAGTAAALSIGFVLTPPGNRVPSGECQLYSLTAQDTYGNSAPDFVGDVTISGLGVSATETFVVGNQGVKQVLLCPTSGSGTITATSGTLTAGSVSVTVESAVCGTTNNWQGTTDTAWATVSNWSGGAVPTASESARINSGGTFAPIVGGMPSVGCLLLDGGSLGVGGAGALGISVRGRMAQWIGTTLTGVDLDFSGASLAQVFSMAGTANGILDQLTLGGTSSSLTFTGTFPLNVNAINSSAGNVLFVDGQLVVNTPMNIPSGATIVVGPGGMLHSKSNLSVAGALVVVGGGSLVMETGKVLSVSGTLALLGTSGGNTASISAYDSGAGTATGSYSFTVSGVGAKFSANHFWISNLDANGINISSSANQISLVNGSIHGIPQSGKGLVFGTGTNVDPAAPYLLNLGFFPDPSATTWTAIDATGLSSPTPAVDLWAPWVDGPSDNAVRNASTDPSKMLVWDY